MLEFTLVECTLKVGHDLHGTQTSHRQDTGRPMSESQYDGNSQGPLTALFPFLDSRQCILTDSTMRRMLTPTIKQSIAVVNGRRQLGGLSLNVRLGVSSHPSMKGGNASVAFGGHEIASISALLDIILPISKLFLVMQKCQIGIKEFVGQ